MPALRSTRPPWRASPHAHLPPWRRLAAAREANGTAVQILRALGVDLNRVRTQTAYALLQAQAPAQEKQASGPAQVGPLDHDLTTAAAAGKLDPLIGHQPELERLIQILCRRAKHNPLIIGESGVGKRALVKGLAQRMVEGGVPPPLLNRRRLVLDVGSLVTSIVYHPLVEERLQQVLDTYTSTGALLLIDRIHTLVGAAGSNVEVANRLKLGLNRGDLQVLGTTTRRPHATGVSSLSCSKNLHGKRQSRSCAVSNLATSIFTNW